MTVLCGGLAFLALAWPEGAAVSRVRRLLWASWAVGMVTSLAGVGLQAAYAGHLGLGAAFRPSVVIPGFDTRAGVAWASRGLLFVLAVPVLSALHTGGADAVRSLGWRVGTAAVGIGLLRTPGLVAHSSEGRMAWLGSVADMAHLIGVAVWLGGLVVLCAVVLPRRQADELRRIVPRFSTMAGTAVAVVVVAGSFLSWQLVGSFGALTGTRFGHVLLVKLALVAAIAGAALLSHRWAADRLHVALAAAGQAGTAALRPFVMSVATEVALAVAVLTVASVLVATSPGR
jgi:putative copper export protein